MLKIVRLGIVLVVAWIVGHIYAEYKLTQVDNCIKSHPEKYCVDTLDWSGRITRKP